jgi:hypothetical protein
MSGFDRQGSRYDQNFRWLCDPLVIFSALATASHQKI